MQNAKLKAVVTCTDGTDCTDSGSEMEWWEMTPGETYFEEFTISTGAPERGLVRAAIIEVDHFFRPSPPYTWVEIQHVNPLKFPTIRCDNQMTKGKIGCVYSGQTPILRYGPSHGQLTGHIAASMTSGTPGSQPTPLHKGTRALETENRDNACKKNPNVPKPVPAQTDCDEYPFASALEGAAAGGEERTFPGCQLPAVAQGVTGPGFSICFIDRHDNRSAGNALRWFYHWNRVLQNDPFYVRATGGALPTE